MADKEPGTVLDEAEQIHAELLEFTRCATNPLDLVARELEKAIGDATATATPYEQAEVLQTETWKGAEDLTGTISKQEVSGTAAGDADIKACWIEPLGHESEIKGASRIAERLVDFGKKKGLVELQKPTVAAGVATVALHAAKVCWLLADGKIDAHTAKSHMESVIAAALLRAIRFGGPKLGAFVGAFIGSPAVGAMIAHEIAEAIGPQVSAVLAKGVTLLAGLVPRVVDSVRQRLSAAQEWFQAAVHA